MRSGRGPVVMVIEQASSFQTQLAAGLSSVLEPLGIPLLLHLWGHSGARPPASLVRVLQDGDPRAAVITPLTNSHSDRRLERLLAHCPSLPLLHLGTVGPGCSVRADNAMGMQLVARHLVRDCHARRVLVVRGIDHHPDSREREVAVRAELARLGVPITEQQLVSGQFDRETAHRVVRDALEGDPEIDAIVALNDRSALGAMDAVTMRGRRVPADVVVTGFDDEDFAAFSLPSLTTVSQNLHEQGVMAGELLLRLLAGDDPGEVRVPVRLMVRGSTGCPPAVEAASEFPREDLLWGQVAALDAVLATNRRFLSCSTEEEIVEQLALSMPLLGITRGFLVLRTEEPGPARGLLTMAYYDGRHQQIAPHEPFDVAHQLPEHLRSHLHHGTLVVQPLAVGDTEIGYLVLDQVLGRGSCIGEALRMDLSRTIDTIRSTARLSERTRQLESEAASRLAAQRALAYRVDHDSLTGLATRTAFLAHAEPAVADSVADSVD
ncbi:MAG: substrate-binding domain-containing protein, partial [Kineosporiaceae bacterium]